MIGEAEFGLGRMYLLGKQVQRDERQAVEWLGRAAELGHGEALVLLGGMYAEGRSVRQNHPRARVLLEAAAAQGYPQAREALRKLPPAS